MPRIEITSEGSKSLVVYYLDIANAIQIIQSNLKKWNFIVIFRNLHHHIFIDLEPSRELLQANRIDPERAAYELLIQSSLSP